MTAEESAPAVRFEVTGPVATLTMDRPATRNALSAELLAGLLDGLGRAERISTVRAVVLAHTGPVFCAGADLRAQDRPGGEPGVGDLPRVLEAIARSPLPVVARLQGHALGGGVGLAAACDVSVAAEEVRLGFTEVRLGVIPAVISVVCLPKLRRGDAPLELFLTGERITAERAARAGLITAAVPAAELDAVVERYLDQLVRGGPRAVAEAKALVYAGGAPAGAYDEMAAVSARLFASAEAVEGRAAFKEKRARFLDPERTGPMRIGLLHPGEMGAAIGAALVGMGHEVSWVPAGRSPASVARAEAAGLVAAGSVAELAARVELILSVCPPHAALDVASSVGPWSGVYLDANAISPERTRQVGRVVTDGGGRFVDGGIVGPPPVRPGATRLYLSGPDAVELTEALATPLIETHVVSEWPGAASALKLAYAAWTKGTAALLLAIRSVAAQEGVDEWLLDEWRTSQPELADQSSRAARSALAKGWRWQGEMEEIAALMASRGLPPGFHQAAAEIFGRVPADGSVAASAALDTVLDLLAAPPDP